MGSGCIPAFSYSAISTVIQSVKGFKRAVMCELVGNVDKWSRLHQREEVPPPSPFSWKILGKNDHLFLKNRNKCHLFNWSSFIEFRTSLKYLWMSLKTAYIQELEGNIHLDPNWVWANSAMWFIKSEVSDSGARLLWGLIGGCCWLGWMR